MPNPIYLPQRQNPWAGFGPNLLQQIVMAKISQNMKLKQMDAETKRAQAMKPPDREGFDTAWLNGEWKYLAQKEKKYDTLKNKEGELYYQEKGKPIPEGAEIPYKEQRENAGVTGDIGQFEAFQYGGPSPKRRGTKQYQQDYLKWVESKKSASPYIDAMDKRLANADRQFGTSLRKEFNSRKEVEDFKEIDFRFDIMNKAIDEARSTKNFIAADQALITTFNKITDPDSVVRESEYARTQSDLSLINKLKGKINKIGSGGPGLTQQDREAIFRLSTQFKDVAKQKYMKTLSEYTGYFREAGMAPTGYLPIEINSDTRSKYGY